VTEPLVQIEQKSPSGDWRDPKVEFRKGVFCYSAQPKNVEYLGMANPRSWEPTDSDWKLPSDWKAIILEGMKERLKKYRSFRLFMDICVRCGACADKCHFYLGSGDPKNMPVVRAELLRSVYVRYFTANGRIFGTGRELTEEVIKEWFYYFYQCTECRRCSVFCPYGIDTAEITMIGRELLNLIGCNIHWIMEPAANCFSRTLSKTASSLRPTNWRILPESGSSFRLTGRGPKSCLSCLRQTISPRRITIRCSATCRYFTK
jgi:ferredoxin